MPARRASAAVPGDMAGCGRSLWRGRRGMGDERQCERKGGMCGGKPLSRGWRRRNPAKAGSLHKAKGRETGETGKKTKAFLKICLTFSPGLEYNNQAPVWAQYAMKREIAALPVTSAEYVRAGFGRLRNVSVCAYIAMRDRTGRFSRAGFSSVAE